MAIEDILKALDDQAQADCDAVVGEAHEHAKLILEEAQREADGVHDGFVRQVERVASTDASKKVNAARLAAKMSVSTVKGDGVTSVFEEARAQLPTLRASGYDRLFAALAAEAFAGLHGSASVHVAAADVEMAREAAAAAGVSADVQGDLDSAGGIVVEFNGGRIVRRNTLEDRLERSRQVVQADVAKVLF